MHGADIDWGAWVPTEVATLLFVRPGDQVLLIRKKRGLGAGKINGPGGRPEPGETPAQAAVREVQEEPGVTPLAPRHHGRQRFEFTDGYRLEVHLFLSHRHHGRAVETDGAAPLWTPVAPSPTTRCGPTIASGWPRSWPDESSRAAGYSMETG